MKKIIILTDFKGELSLDLKNTLKKIFENYVIIENLYLNSIKENDIIDGDVILFMLENRFEKYSHHIKNKENVIIISRTIKKEVLKKLEVLPKDEPILVVNDFYETTLQLTSLLYRTKYKYLKLISYNEKEKKDLSYIKYAITPGIKEKVPKGITNIIDLGVRVLDLFTIISIANKLKLNENIKIINNILLYIDEIVFIKNGIEEHYRDLYLKNKELEGLLTNNSDGIILINDKNKILFFNKRACDFLNIPLEINQYFFKIIESNLHIENFENKKNDIIEIKGNFYYILFNQIKLYNNQYLLISLKDITELKKWKIL
ncbi:PAS domain-containing protein [Fusobacterium perfoetens]|uniref:PAS domain-containing protein n=1 Tax=Fusobacterium perfoetens TaxID=852 RepID=UPI0009DD3C78|nr:PAS domain-containing protein [Fusobacterium perfoetens]